LLCLNLRTLDDVVNPIPWLYLNIEVSSLNPQRYNHNQFLILVWNRIAKLFWDNGYLSEYWFTGQSSWSNV
jgi:hypothetical protein